MTAYTAQQRQIAARIIAVGKRLGASPKALKASIETGIVEANLRNPKTATDHDSLGTFQQRPSQGWGSASQVTNVEHAAASFFKRAIPIAAKYGTAGELAQAVQRSAFPGRYDQAGGSAESLLRDLAGARSMNPLAPRASTVGSGENAAIDAANERGRMRAVAGRLIAKREPNSLLLSSGVLDPNFTPQAHVAETPAAAPAAATSAPAQGDGKVQVAPGAERAGKALQQPILDFLHQLSSVSGRTVRVTTGTNHNQFVAGEPGVQSDHWDGNATDLGLDGDARQSTKVAHQGDLIAAHAIQIAGGVSFPKALAMARKGGVFNFETKQGRVQVLWKTMTGGNHYNHVHIGLNPNQ